MIKAMNIPNNKFDKNYRWYVSSCLSKRVYETAEEAIHNAIGFGHMYNAPEDVYLCSFCGKYHITTHTEGNRLANNAIHVMDKDGCYVASNRKIRKLKFRQTKLNIARNMKQLKKKGSKNGK